MIKPWLNYSIVTTPRNAILLMLFIGLALGGALSDSALAASTQPWMSASESPSQRADALLAHMSLDEKITMLHGATGSRYTGFIPPNKRLGIPALNFIDGPAGVSDGLQGVTQLPAPVTAAASWDRKILHDYGALLGAEQSGKGANVSLAPTINIVRDPRWGRAFETLGEDPYLTSELGVAEINGIQQQGIIAQAKHWAIYNQETYRLTRKDNVQASRRTMQEIYMPAFKAAIKQGRVGSLMCSYNVLHGKFACTNPYLLTNVLRKQWGFKGFVTSDWHATPATLTSAKAGLDMEMPNDKYFGPPLEAAVKSDKISKKTINTKVHHILIEIFRFGLFDHQNKGSIDAKVTSPAHARFARQAAEQGTVLLKNQGGILPLARAAKSIAVIGNDADAGAMTAGGGSAHVTAPYIVTPLQGIKKRAGNNVTVHYAQGNVGRKGAPVIPAKYLAPGAHTSKHGLKGIYYNNPNLRGDPVLTRVDSTIDFDWNGTSPGPGVHPDQWSAQWTGILTPPKSGAYTFTLDSDNGSRLYIDGEKLIDHWPASILQTKPTSIALEAGHHYKIRIDYQQYGSGSWNHLGWSHAGASLQQKAVKLARASDIAIVFAGDYETEGNDRANITLPGTQNELIRAIAKANNNTIVVLNTGAPVTMPWVRDVAGIVEAWYPGQEDGNAIASILFGDVNPSGHLPVTFPKSLKQVPANIEKRWPGIDGKVHYSEGLLVGYRWYDQKDIKPLYPFGYGLSYTQFQIKHLKFEIERGGSLHVSCSITNTGKRAGADVVQLYVSDPSSVGEPPKQLKAFKKVYLKAHEQAKVTFKLDSSAFSYWNSETNSWDSKSGSYQIYVGDSSRHLPLKNTLQISYTSR